MTESPFYRMQKGTTARQWAELSVRWRQLGRAIAKEVPVLGVLGRFLVRLPLIRHTYEPKRLTEKQLSRF